MKQPTNTSRQSFLAASSRQVIYDIMILIFKIRNQSELFQIIKKLIFAVESSRQAALR
jgi:hypothetical protein